MSHQPERKEKDCLNCGTTVAGRYCQKCGQENIIPKQSFGGLIRHFIYDVFHFDGKFFDTLKYLIFRPGFIPKQYVRGKRQSWLDPIRMYLFTSAVFFLVFFSLAVAEKSIKMDGDRLMTKPERFEYAALINHQWNSGNTDTTLVKQLDFLLDTNYKIVLSDSAQPTNDTSFLIHFKNKNELMTAKKKTREESEIIIGSGWLNRQVEARWKAYKLQYGDDTKAIVTDMIDSFLHKMPYMLFVSLPFFALILKLLYIRRKNFYYSDHAVFTLYHFIFSFILLLFFFLLSKLYDLSGWGIFNFIRIMLFLSGGVYLLIAMKRFYMQGRGKTFLKFLLLNLSGLIVMLFLFIAFLILSIFQI